jgi:Arc/MetJ-type ribon-helix-helix transcriptional regulator
MSTISVPLNAEVEKKLNHLVKSGAGANKADVVRRAIIRMSDDEAVEEVLKSMSEPTLKGDLRALAKKIK